MSDSGTPGSGRRRGAARRRVRGDLEHQGHPLEECGGPGDVTPSPLIGEPEQVQAGGQFGVDPTAAPAHPSSVRSPARSPGCQNRSPGWISTWMSWISSGMRTSAPALRAWVRPQLDVLLGFAVGQEAEAAAGGAETGRGAGGAVGTGVGVAGGVRRQGVVRIGRPESALCRCGRGAWPRRGIEIA